LNGDLTSLWKKKMPVEKNILDADSGCINTLHKFSLTRENLFAKRVNEEQMHQQIYSLLK
jgi:hypothetical protein